MRSLAAALPKRRRRNAHEWLAIVSSVLLGVGVLFSRYASVPTTPDSTIRSFVVVIAVAVASLLLFRLATHSWIWAGILSSAFVLLNLRELLLAIPLLAFCAWWPLISLLRRRQERPPADPSIPRSIGRATGIVAIVYCLVMFVSAAQALVSSTPMAHFPAYAGDEVVGPNIYVLLLDGYPRIDTLESDFQYDNAAFVEELASRGFTTATRARANYPKTWLTLASFFNGAYVTDMLGNQESPPDSDDQLRWLQSLLARASILDPLRESGYTIKTMPSAFRSTSLSSADEVIDGGSMNDFEARLIWQSPWMVVLRDQVGGFLLDAQRDEVSRSLESLSAVAEAHDGPQFVFSHVHSPHPPFVLGQEASVPECLPLTCSLWHVTTEELGLGFAEYRTRFVEQLEALNGLVLQTVGRVIEADPTAVVVVMSDHGARYSLGDVAEHYRSFLSWRAPGHPDLFADNETVVNILRDVVRTYFNVDAPRLENHFWLADWENNLELQRLDDIGE